MSSLETVAKSALQTKGQFTFLGDDGFIVQANDLDGVLAVTVTDSESNLVFDHYADFALLLRHLKAHGGHLHH